MITNWQPIETAPEDDCEVIPFLVFIPRGAPDQNLDLVLQVTRFQGDLYPCHMGFNVDWTDRVTTATHWCPMEKPR